MIEETKQCHLTTSAWEVGTITSTGSEARVGIKAACRQEPSAVANQSQPLGLV